jgi:hypothetical protein
MNHAWAINNSRRMLSALRDFFCEAPYGGNDQMWFSHLDVVTAVICDLMLSLRRTPRQLLFQPASNG